MQMLCKVLSSGKLETLGEKIKPRCVLAQN